MKSYFWHEQKRYGRPIISTALLSSTFEWAYHIFIITLLSTHAICYWPCGIGVCRVHQMMIARQIYHCIVVHIPQILLVSMSFNCCKCACHAFHYCKTRQTTNDMNNGWNKQTWNIQNCKVDKLSRVKLQDFVCLFHSCFCCYYFMVLFVESFHSLIYLRVFISYMNLNKELSYSYDNTYPILYFVSTKLWINRGYRE